MKQSDIGAVYRVLRREYARRNAPVARLSKARTDEPFRVLLTTMLSTRTKDETTLEAATRLFRVVRDADALRRIRRTALERLIFPVGFYRTKARHLKALPGTLDRLFGGRIPDTVEELCRLPGVGRKVASLVVTDGFGKPAICVDVHVHRICNRLGLLRTRSPNETEQELRRILPVRYWRTWNPFLVSHGQTLCKPVGPRCDNCPLRPWCDRVGVGGTNVGASAGSRRAAGTAR